MAGRDQTTVWLTYFVFVFGSPLVSHILCFGSPLVSQTLFSGPPLVLLRLLFPQFLLPPLTHLVDRVTRGDSQRQTILSQTAVTVLVLGAGEMTVVTWHRGLKRGGHRNHVGVHEERPGLRRPVCTGSV